MVSNLSIIAAGIATAFSSAAMAEPDSLAAQSEIELDIQPQSLRIPQEHMAQFRQFNNPHDWADQSILGQDGSSFYGFDHGYDWSAQAPEDGTARFGRFSDPAEVLEQRCGRAILRSSLARCELDNGLRVSIPTYVPGRH